MLELFMLGLSSMLQNKNLSEFEWKMPELETRQNRRKDGFFFKRAFLVFSHSNEDFGAKFKIPFLKPFSQAMKGFKVVCFESLWYIIYHGVRILVSGLRSNLVPYRITKGLLEPE